MSKLEKALERFYRKPIPNDITFREVEMLAEHFGCRVISGGKHMRIVHAASGTVIPIPRHGNTVKEAYIKQIKTLFDEIETERK